MKIIDDSTREAPWTLQSIPLLGADQSLLIIALDKGFTREQLTSLLDNMEDLGPNRPI